MAVLDKVGAIADALVDKKLKMTFQVRHAKYIVQHWYLNTKYHREGSIL